VPEDGNAGSDAFTSYADDARFRCSLAHRGAWARLSDATARSQTSLILYSSVVSGRTVCFVPHTTRVLDTCMTLFCRRASP
jgi:hypothetical protein